MVIGAVDTGWTFYTPYSTTTDGSVGLMTMAVFILGFSSIFTGLNFIATMHKLRAPGMGWFDMPLFVWGIYATGVIQILATPVLAITLVLLLIERVFQIGIFDSRIGGDPVLFQHFFWFYSHPAVYIMILPGMAIISEIIPTFSRKTIFGYRAIAYSSVSLALLSFIVWGHHLFVAGESDLANVIFSALTFLVAIPSGVKMFNWLTTMYKGNISFETPMLYAMAFLFLFAIGGLTGIFFSTLAVDIHLTDTYFVVAHFHYVMMGGTVIAFLGGLHYWWPKMTGRMYSEKWGRIALRPGLHRLQHDLRLPVHHGRPGHAAALFQLSRPVPAHPRLLHLRKLGAGLGPVPDRDLFAGIAQEWASWRPTIPGAAQRSSGNRLRRPWSTILKSSRFSSTNRMTTAIGR